MVRVEMTKWGHTLEDLRRLALQAAHPRTRERFLALAQIADGTDNATTWAARYGRQDETVMRWVHTYNEVGPDALTYRRTGGAAPFCARAGPGPSRHRPPHRADRPRPERPRLDAQEAPTVGHDDLRRRSQPQRHPPRAPRRRAELEAHQEAAGQGQTGQAGRARRAARGALRTGPPPRGDADLHRRVALPPGPRRGVYLGAQGAAVVAGQHHAGPARATQLVRGPRLHERPMPDLGGRPVRRDGDLPLPGAGPALAGRPAGPCGDHPGRRAVPHRSDGAGPRGGSWASSWSPCRGTART